MKREALHAANQEFINILKEYKTSLLDSGATAHYNKPSDDLPITGPSNKTVMVAFGQTGATTHQAQLPMTQLTADARKTDILPALTTNSLMSVKVLADNGYTTVFHPHDGGAAVLSPDSFELKVKGEPILSGYRDEQGLWRIPLVADTNSEEKGMLIKDERFHAEAIHNVYELPSMQQVVRFLHAALGFPTKQTLIAAINNGHLNTFPGLTAHNVSKHFPESDETQKGHMKQQRQGTRSTKPKMTNPSDSEPNNPASEATPNESTTQPGIKHRDVYLHVYDATKRSMYTDQTGKFPIVSARGNQYIMVAVELDGNYIDGEPMKTREASSLVKAYNAIMERWSATQVIAPNWHVLDNEAPQELKEAIRKNGCTVELTPPDMHRRNIAERAIQTGKNHFISCLAGLPDDFPIREWDELLPQVFLTLNLLRPSNVAPKISAYAYHHGQFDYDRMPLAPMGCAVQFHIKPKRRKSWGEHSEDGWYLRTSPEHYRCHIVYVKKTKAKRVSDTVYFKHKYITQPSITPADAVIKALHDLTQAIKGERNIQGAAQFNAIAKLQEAFSPGNQLVPEQYVPEQRRQIQPAPRVEAEAQAQLPRVRFSTEVPKPATYTDDLRVPLDRPRVEQQALPEVKIKRRPPLIVTSKPPDEADTSIAARVKARRQAAPAEPTPAPPMSIAERVKARQRGQIHTVVDMETGELLEYRKLLRHPRFKDEWSLSAANEFGRLAQGVGGRVKGTNTIEFIHKSEIPNDRWKDITYIKFVCTVRTEKKEPNRTRATMGGNINYPDDVGTPTATLLLIKIFLNSVISTPGAKFATADISNFYLMTPLTRPEYARIKLSDIPEEIIREYNLHEKATADGWIYIKVTKGMYGLPQSGSLAHDLLKERLNAEGYFQSKIVAGLWKHITKKIQFVLVVDDFGIKYIRDEDLHHLIKTLEKYYDVALDKTGQEYVKINLDWDYKGGKVHLSMKPYLDKALKQFGIDPPPKSVNSPYPHTIPKYGAQTQYAEYDNSPAAGKEAQKHTQQVTGKFLWYARGVDSTLLTALSALAAQQSKPTVETMKRVKQLLQFIASQEPAVLTYRKSDMVLAAHSDAGYLNEANARSRAGGHHYLSENTKFPPNNGAIQNIAEIIKAVMSSAAEAELGALYINARKAIEERNILEEMGHPQPPTPMQTDNSTAEAIINARVQPKRTKAMDMRFHWLRDRAVNQKQFRFFWRPGPLNFADYWTKHHSPAHHINMRPEFLTPFKTVLELRAQNALSPARVC